MSVRSVILGVGLGLAVAGLTYFNDQVIYQTYFIGNHLPIVIFGLVVLTLLVINPLLGRFSPRLPLRAGEIAIIAALGLVVCGWPGSNLLRYYTGVMALPPQRMQNQPAWQAADVMRYLPGHPDAIEPDRAPLLLNRGVYDPALVDPLLAGTNKALSPDNVPWSAWLPTLALWLDGALLLGGMALCLAVIVHPQWAERERLPYPTVRFVQEIAARSAGRLLPDIAHDRAFWIGFGGILLGHLVIGLHTWFPAVPELPRYLDFLPLLDLFPSARRVPDVNFLFHPILYPSVIGFAYFLRTRVSASVGLSLVAWVAFGAVLIGSGIPLRDDRFAIDHNGTFLRLGSWTAATIAILYYGRRYYGRVAGAAVGLRSVDGETPASSVWAARALGVGVGLFLVLMVREMGATLLGAALLLAMLLMIFVVLARINAETGLFHAQPDFLPSAMITGLLGAQAVGPQGYLVLTLASLVFVADPREAVMPYLTNALRLGDGVANTSPRRLVPPLAGMLVAGLLVATVATLSLQYTYGVNLRDTWSNRMLPEAPFTQTSRQITQLDAVGELDASTGLSSLGSLLRIDPEPGVVGWTALGFVLFAACATARLRLSWWPIHPVLLLVWGTWPAGNLAVSFLIGAAVKWTVVHYVGERGFRRFLPVMVGLIAADLVAALGWNLVGWVYFGVTGLQPSVYRILP